MAQDQDEVEVGVDVVGQGGLDGDAQGLALRDKTLPPPPPPSVRVGGNGWSFSVFAAHFFPLLSMASN